jgi:hypothetical protein
MSSNALSHNSAAMLEVTQPELESRVRELAAGPAGDWLCVWCLNRVADETDRFSYGGKQVFAFTNPEGIRFEILTFSRTLGCCQTGIPSLQYTWFEGHAWSYCQCGGCRQHLGWYYSGEHEFVGLIKSRLVRGLHARN